MSFWTRRRILKAGVKAAMGGAVAAGSSTSAFAQMGPPSPLGDPRVRCVETTEADAWQSKTVFKPIFSWDTLNLNIDPARALSGSRPIEGFGACFNELGWTSLQMLNEADRESVLHELLIPRPAPVSLIAARRSVPTTSRRKPTRDETWGWAQNPLISVDSAAKSFHYTHDYYL